MNFGSGPVWCQKMKMFFFFFKPEPHTWKFKFQRRFQIIEKKNGKNYKKKQKNKNKKTLRFGHTHTCKFRWRFQWNVKNDWQFPNLSLSMSVDEILLEGIKMYSFRLNNGLIASLKRGCSLLLPLRRHAFPFFVWRRKCALLRIQKRLLSSAVPNISQTLKCLRTYETTDFHEIMHAGVFLGRGIHFRRFFFFRNISFGLHSYSYRTRTEVLNSAKQVPIVPMFPL